MSMLANLQAMSLVDVQKLNCPNNRNPTLFRDLQSSTNMISSDHSHQHLKYYYKVTVVNSGWYLDLGQACTDEMKQGLFALSQRCHIYGLSLVNKWLYSISLVNLKGRWYPHLTASGCEICRLNFEGLSEYKELIST